MSPAHSSRPPGAGVCVVGAHQVPRPADLFEPMTRTHYAPGGGTGPF